MQFVTVGLDHTTAPLAVRERFALAGPALDRALLRLREAMPEGMILSTCNRTEYYALAGHEESGRRVLANLLLAGAESDIPLPDSCTISHAGDAAVHRLFAIASGTRSMVTGECDILRQIKVALARAVDLGTCGPSIHRLATTALAVGKRVRRDTAIGRRPTSVVSIALDRAASILDTTIAPRVVILGAGDTAEQSLQYLDRTALARPSDVTIVGRHDGRTRQLAQRGNVRNAPWESLGGLLESADLVICCTSAATHVVDARQVLAVQRVRNQAPLVFVDLAAPRDVEPMVRNITGVTVVDLDEVERIAEARRARQDEALGAAETIIGQYVERYATWWRSRQVTPTITAFVARSAQIRDAEVERTLLQLPGLSPAEQRVITLMAARLANKLMHTPLAALNRHPDAATMAVALRQLFDLSPAGGPPLPDVAAGRALRIDRSPG